jgi:predicted amidophosphoribosyltransferase
MSFVSARAAVAYQGPARSFVHAWKERALRRGAALAADLVAAHLEAPAVDVITHIPPDRDRLLERGHHPAAQLAHEISTRWEIPEAALLRRAGTSAPQTQLSRADRLRNVRTAFVGCRAAPKTVLLVDDVYTTGATTTAASAALRAAGAGQVRVVTFARTVR